MTTNDKKPAVEQPEYNHDEVSRISEENLQAVALDIDRQMKTLAEMDTRVLITKERLADFQEMIQARISTFQNKSAGKQTENHTDIMRSIRETRERSSRRPTAHLCRSPCLSGRTGKERSFPLRRRRG